MIYYILLMPIVQQQKIIKGEKMKKLILCVVVIALVLGSCTRKQAQAVSTWQGGLQREWDVNSSKNQQHAYNWFYDQYGMIKSTAQQIKVLDPVQDRVELNGLKMNLAQWIAQYNENVKKDEGMARYMPDDLPQRLDPRDFGL